MLRAIEMSGCEQMAVYLTLPKRLGYTSRARSVRGGQRGWKAWVHKQNRRGAFGHAALVEDNNDVMSLVNRHYHGGAISFDVHTEELGKLT
jgi:hypothetical protein